ncbi:MAG: hypothetical protein RLZZ519_1177 [Bacteroidota bacterium]
MHAAVALIGTFKHRNLVGIGLYLMGIAPSEQQIACVAVQRKQTYRFDFDVFLDQFVELFAFFNGRFYLGQGEFKNLLDLTEGLVIRQQRSVQHLKFLPIHRAHLFGNCAFELQFALLKSVKVLVMADQI